MKKLQVVPWLFLVVAFLSCAPVHKGSSLIGKWRLTETLADPGDGSGKWRTVGSNESYLVFSSDGSVSGTEFPDFRSFTLDDSAEIEFTLKDNRKQIFSYRYENGELIISPPCIEACGSKYTKVN